jgi:hypothetical protein
VHPHGATHLDPIGARPNDTLHSRLLSSVLSATLMLFFFVFLSLFNRNDNG